MPEPENKDFGPIFWLHLLVLCLMYSSPFLFSWQLIMAGVVLYFFQLLVFGGCILTILEFGKDRKEDFNIHYLRRIGCNISESKLGFILNFVIPSAILATTLVWQIILKHSPYFGI